MPEPPSGRCGIAGVEPALFGLVGVFGLLRGDVDDTLRSTDVIPAAGTCCFTTFAVAAGGAVASVAGRITSDLCSTGASDTALLMTSFVYQMAVEQLEVRGGCSRCGDTCDTGRVLVAGTGTSRRGAGFGGGLADGATPAAPNSDAGDVGDFCC